MLYTKLRSFHVVAREGSITKASSVVNISQPTLSTQIKQFEEQYGLELFCRRGRHLELTDQGQRLLLLTQDIFDCEEKVTNFLLSVQDEVCGQLRITSIGPFRIMKLLRRFKELYPNVNVSINLGNSDEVMRRLNEQRADIAIVSQIEPTVGIVGTRFKKQSVLAFVSRAHDWAKRDSIKLAELDGQNMVMREEGSTTRLMAELAFEKYKIKPNIVMEVGSREAVWEAVAEGHGIGLVSEISLRPDARIKTLSISDHDMQKDISIVCLERQAHAPTVRAFIELVESIEGRGLGLSDAGEHSAKLKPLIQSNFLDL